MLRVIFLLELLYTLLSPAAALAWSDDATTPEGWALKQMLNGKVADFNMHCGAVLDPHKPVGWGNPCRQISPDFLADLLTEAKWKQKMPLHGVRLRGAHIVGHVDLDNAEIDSEFSAEASLISGSVSLVDAHLKRVFSLNESVLDGALDATRMSAATLVTLGDRSSFGGDVTLSGATIGGDLEMDGANLSKKLVADALNVHGGLFARDHASFGGDVTLIGARIGGNFELDTASFSSASRLDANRLDVHGALFMRDHASFGGDVILRGATVGGNLEMNSATFLKTLDANRLEVHGSLRMRDHASFGDSVILIGARIGGNLEMDTAHFSKTLAANRLEVHGSLIMRDQAYFGDDVSLEGASVVRVDLTSAKASSIDLSDLSGATGSELQIVGLQWRCRRTSGDGDGITPINLNPQEQPVRWTLGDTSNRTAQCVGKGESLPRLIMRNTHIESLQDDADSWPPLIDLEGLRYDRLAGQLLVVNSGKPPRTREAWIDWLARNRNFSQQPYNQLAGVLAAAGRRDTSEAILFAGRERERDEIWKSPNVGFWPWLRHDFWSWVWLSFLSGVAGYGIGLYTFRVLWWVAGLTLLGAGVLWFSPYARARSVAWRIGASLHRLLPIVQLNREFEDFFDNVVEPGKPRKFYGWQVAFFSAIALAGWILGFFLLAAMGGLIQK
jgi:hypothetical protein